MIRPAKLAELRTLVFCYLLSMGILAHTRISMFQKAEMGQPEKR